MILKGDSSCTACGLFKTTSRVCVMGHGGTEKKIMVIGEAPGAREEETGKPFQGKAGKLLDDALADAGIARRDVYVSNAVHCRPPENRTPKRKEIEACKTWVQFEMKRVKPKYVLLLGNAACQSVLGKKGIKSLRGSPLEEDGVLYFPAYHPSFALRDPRQEPIFRSDLQMFARVIKQGGLIADPDFSFTIVTEKNLRRFLGDLERNDWWSYDCETSGLFPWAPGAYITSMGFGTRKHNWCLPLGHHGEHDFKLRERQEFVIRQIDRIRKKKRVKLIGHNGKFDTNWTKVIYGLDWPIEFDTMLAHYNLDENTPHDLGQLSQRFLGAIDYDIPLEEKHGYGPLNRHCQYLGLDVYYTRRLWRKFRRDLKEDEATHVLYYRLTMPVARMFADVEQTGVYVEPTKLLEAREYWKGRAARTLKKLDKLWPSKNAYKDKFWGKRKGVNWNSADQVRDIMFDELDLTPIDKTDGGKWSVSESVMLQLREHHKLPALILRYREAMKNLGTFIEAWQRAANDNYLHPTFKVHGTVTGRPSCAEPNLQQVPRDPRIRSLITAPPGWTLVDADFSQVELRLVAAASKDPELLMCYSTGVDVHTLTVQRIFGIAEPTKEERKKGKAINFGFIYGMWWKKFKKYALDNYEVVFSDRECERIRNEFFRLYSGLPAWHKRQKKFARGQGYVRNLIGRMRRLPRAQDQRDSFERGEAERQAINSPIQSLASDLNLMAAVELHQKLDRSFFRISGTVHDSILMLVRNDKLNYVLPIIKKTMERPKLLDELDVHIGVPIEAEIEVGPWSAGKKWETGKRAA